MGYKDRLVALMGPWRLISYSLQLHWEALKDAIGENGLRVFFNLQRVRIDAQTRLLVNTSAGFIQYENGAGVPELVAAARGRILELGPGPGNQINRFDTSKVDFIYGVDPNPGFASVLAEKLHDHELKDRYKFIACGIEDSDILVREGIIPESLDTVTSIQVLCAVKDVESVMKEVYRLLKPGGQFIFWEHGKSKDRVTSVAQLLWEPVWHNLVGCHMDRTVVQHIFAAGEWEKQVDWVETKDPYTCLPRTQGVLIKKKGA